MREILQLLCQQQTERIGINIMNSKQAKSQMKFLFGARQLRLSLKFKLACVQKKNPKKNGLDCRFRNRFRHPTEFLSHNITNSLRLPSTGFIYD